MITQFNTLSQIEQSLSPYFKMAWDDIANASTFISGDATNLDDWNAFFDLPNIANGFTFRAITITDNTIKLSGGIGLDFSTSFNGATHLLSTTSNINGLSAIGTNTFKNNTNGTTFGLPTLIYAGAGCFENCTGVILFDLSSLQGLGANIFTGISGKTFTIKIPIAIFHDTQILNLLIANPLATLITT